MITPLWMCSQSSVCLISERLQDFQSKEVKPFSAHSQCTWVFYVSITVVIGIVPEIQLKQNTWSFPIKTYSSCKAKAWKKLSRKQSFISFVSVTIFFYLQFIWNETFLFSFLLSVIHSKSWYPFCFYWRLFQIIETSKSVLRFWGFLFAAGSCLAKGNRFTHTEFHRYESHNLPTYLFWNTVRDKHRKKKKL